MYVVSVTRLIRISYGDYHLNTVVRSKLPALRVPVIQQKHRRQGRIRTAPKAPMQSATAEKSPAVQWMRAGQ